ncbi:MAG: hypothetical protein ACRDGS_14450 [Chloroflexota bacterium]
MPTSYTRQRVEIPRDLYQALNQAARDAAMPTSALITTWLCRMLETRRPDLHVRDPYRNGVELYDRRPRRPGELPDQGSLAAIRAAAEDDECRSTAATAPPPPNLTTVNLALPEGGILSTSDRPPTQS